MSRSRTARDLDTDHNSVWIDLVVIEFPQPALDFPQPSSDLQQPLDSDLPSYNEVMEEAYKPPPTYESLFGKISEIPEATKFWKFKMSENLKKILVIFSRIVTFCLGDFPFVPESMVAIGWFQRKRCPQSTLLPYFLIIGGVLGLIEQFFFLVPHVCYDCDSIAKPLTKIRAKVDMVLNYALAGWFVIASFWVYIMYEPEYDPRYKSIYCSKLLYLYMFWLINCVYLVMAFLISLLTIYYLFILMIVMIYLCYLNCTEPLNQEAGGQ